MDTKKLIKDLFNAMRCDFDTMSYYGDNERALWDELTTATPDILQEYKNTFLND